MKENESSPEPNYGFGEIDWFGNQQTGGKYGFIKEADGTDHFFTGHSCCGFNPMAGTIVVFELTPSTRHQGKLDAINVCQLSTFDDNNLLLFLAFKKTNYKLNNKYFQALAQRYGEVVAFREWNGTEIINHFLETGFLPRDISPTKICSTIQQPLAFLFAGLLGDLQAECIGLLLSKQLLPLVGTHPYDVFNSLQELLKNFPDNSKQLLSQIGKVEDAGTMGALLWIHNLNKHDNPLEYGGIVSGLTILDQRLYLKKLVASKLTHRREISVKMLRSFVWTDISTWVVLEIIDCVIYNRAITSQGVIGCIISHIESPESDINIDGYFDECLGRAYFENGAIKRSKVPRFTKWCEGRLLPQKKAKEGEEVDDRPRWWCANQCCSASSILDREPVDYCNYTLWNILKAFEVNYNRSEYEKMLGTLNRIRQLTDRVRCRDCNHIMHPHNKGQSNYAFYLVNRFCCANPACQNREEVYLSHCINGACSNIIDSRDSARCKPDGHSQDKCGWYICCFCLSCCTTEGLERRKSIMERVDQEYKCHLVGHRDRHEICCPTCGTVLQIIKRTDFRDWFARQANNVKYIFKHGERKDGGKWFLIKKSGFKDENQFQEFSKHALASGYAIPDLEDELKNVYLFGEPLEGKFDPLLQCPQCKFDLDMIKIVEDRDYQHLEALRIHDFVNELHPRPTHHVH